MPYFRAGIQSLVPREFPGLGTLGVTEGSILMVDYEVLGQMTVNEAAAVLIHEYLHRFFRHAERARTLHKAGVLAPGDERIWNEACDAEINDNLIEAHLELPELGGGKPITPATFNMPAHRTAEEYFAELKRRKEQQPPGAGGQGQPPPGWGQCGSGAGNPLPDEPDAKDPAARSPVEQEMQRRQDSEQVQQQAGSRRAGSVPMGIQRAAGANLEPAKISWQDKLSAAVREAVMAVSGSGDYTFTARSRMQSTMELMLGEDAPVLPGEHCPLAEVAFVIDASGSMGDALFAPILSEAQAVLRHMGGARVTFVSFDTEVHSLLPVRSVEEMRANIKGGGGTYFNPVFDALSAHKPRPNVVVFATDLYPCDTPKEPDGMRVVWLAVGNGPDPDFGEVVRCPLGDVADEEAA
jgi:predicted metal-dependent peptidase